MLLSLLLSGLRLAPVPVVDAFVAVLRDQGPVRPAGHGKVDSRCRAGPAGYLIVCAEAATVRQAVAEADRALPGVIVMDVRLQDGSGIEATRDIRAARPQTPVLMLTSFADDQALFASILPGAAGYVLKQIRSDGLVQAIRTVGAGQSLLDPAVTKGVLDRLRKGKHLLKDERLARLSPQEERILELVSTGRTNKQIGEELHLAEKTVKNAPYAAHSRLRLRSSSTGGYGQGVTRCTREPSEFRENFGRFAP